MNNRANQRFKDVLNLFGEPNTVKCEEFFGIISTWGTQIEQAVLSNEKRRLAAAKPPPSVVIPKKPSSQYPPEINAKAGNPAGGAPAGEFDTIVKQLKNGTLYRKEGEAFNSNRAAAAAASAAATADKNKKKKS